MTADLRDTVIGLLRSPERLAAMSTAAAAFGHRDADEALTDLVLSAAGRSS